MGSFCTPTYSPLPESGETVEGTEIPAWVAAAGRTLFERSAELADSDYPDVYRRKNCNLRRRVG